VGDLRGRWSIPPRKTQTAMTNEYGRNACRLQTSTGFLILFNYWQKIQYFSRTPMKKFLGLFRSAQMFKYNEKTSFTYKLQYSEYSPLEKFQQNSKMMTLAVFRKRYATVNKNGRYSIAACFPFEPIKMRDFRGYFSRTLKEQSDFPRLFRCRNFQEKNPGLTRRRGNPDWNTEIILAQQKHFT